MIDDVFAQRVFDKFDKFEEKIDDLCGRMVRVETNLSNHLEAQRTKFNKTTMVIGIIIAAVALMAAFK